MFIIYFCSLGPLYVIHQSQITTNYFLKNNYMPYGLYLIFYITQRMLLFMLIFLLLFATRLYEVFVCVVNQLEKLHHAR